MNGIKWIDLDMLENISLIPSFGSWKSNKKELNDYKGMAISFHLLLNIIRNHTRNINVLKSFGFSLNPTFIIMRIIFKNVEIHMNIFLKPTPMHDEIKLYKLVSLP